MALNGLTIHPGAGVAVRAAPRAVNQLEMLRNGLQKLRAGNVARTASVLIRKKAAATAATVPQAQKAPQRPQYYREAQLHRSVSGLMEKTQIATLVGIAGQIWKFD